MPNFVPLINNNMTPITPEALFTPALFAQAMDFSAYMQLSEQLVAEGRTSGPNQSEAYVYYTKLNLQRMKRLNKTVEVPAQPTGLMKQKANNWRWITITEPWGGCATNTQQSWMPTSPTEDARFLN